jgi:hypothetical protein
VEGEDHVGLAARLGDALGQIEREPFGRVDQQQPVPGLDPELLGERGA